MKAEEGQIASAHRRRQRQLTQNGGGLLARRLPWTVCLSRFRPILRLILSTVDRRHQPGVPLILFSLALVIFFVFSLTSSKAIPPLSLKISLLVRNIPFPLF
jgi:hypothetical protein